MADKIQNAYETSKNIYDDVLTQRNIFSKLYIKLFWSGTDDIDRSAHGIPRGHILAENVVKLVVLAQG